MPTPAARAEAAARSVRPQSNDGTPRATGTADAASARATDRVTLSSESQEPTKSRDSNREEDAAAPRGKDGEPLSEAEQKQLDELQARDREVRQHEQAHKAAAGPYATSGPTYSYQEGPDGRRYAVGGSVGIDVSPEATPEETIAKMQVVRRAALAPAEPSSQDRRVAAQASRIEQQARTEQARQREEAETRQAGEVSGAGVSGIAQTPGGLSVATAASSKLEAYTPPSTPTFAAVA